MRAVCYCRVSTDEQVDGYSLDKQEEDCIKLIKSKGYTFIESYVDDGYSGKNTNRPAIQRLLLDITKRKIDILVVWNTDRLSRDVIDGLLLVKNFINKYNVQFASVTEDIDTSTSDGMMMFTMRLLFAQRERERIGERVSMGLAKKASTGLRVSLGAIIGYDKVNGELVVNESEAETVRRIFDLYVYKGYGYGKIAALLNEEGVLAKKTKWHHSTVKSVLGNFTYVGINVHTPAGQKPIIIKGTHTPIIDDKLFQLAQTQLKGRKEGTVSRSSHSYPFSVIVKCGECGASYIANNTVKRRNDKLAYTNYRCGNRKPGLCKASDIAEIKLEKLFFDYFEKIQIEVEDYTPPKTDRNLDKERSRLEKEIIKLDTRKNNLLDDLGDRLITRDEYKAKAQQIMQQLDKAKADLDKLQPDEVNAQRSTTEVISLIKDLEINWPLMQPEDRKFMIQFLFKRIEIKKHMDWTIQKIDPA